MRLYEMTQTLESFRLVDLYMSSHIVHACRMMRHTALLFVVIQMCLAGFAAENDPDKLEWIQLFNGEDLEGWQVKLAGHRLNDNYGDTFRAENGVLKVVYDQYENFDMRFGHIFFEKKYSHYVLKLEYRFLGEQLPDGPEWAFRNSGIMFHSQSPESVKQDQDFPICIEAQLLGGDGSHERTTHNLCTPATHVVMNGELVTNHCVNSTSETYHGDQWVSVVLVVLGADRVEHWVEGQPVLSYEKPQIGGENVHNFDARVKQDGKLLEEGYISLQSESHPVEFRNIELLDLTGCTDRKASNYKSYFIKSDNSKCEYR